MLVESQAACCYLYSRISAKLKALYVSLRKTLCDGGKMHGNDSWLTLVLLFAVFVLLPQLTKFIKVQPEKASDKKKPIAKPAPITISTTRNAEQIKPIQTEHAYSEPSPHPIEPSWF